MKIEENYRPVTIKIFVSHLFHNDEILLNMTSGVEEESIPFEVEIKNLDDGVVLAYNGANESVLQVGIGVDSKGIIAVHYKTLDRDKPLFKINYNGEKDKVRSICSNGARLVKGVPFIFGGANV